MSYGYFQNYIPVLLMFGVLAFMAGTILFLSYLLGPRRPSRLKLAPYESGVPPKGGARSRVNVKFCRVAIAFILFNAVVVFLYPWAVVFHQLRMYGFLAMLLFLLLVVPGYIYLWKKGVFNWNRTGTKDSGEP